MSEYLLVTCYFHKWEAKADNFLLLFMRLLFFRFEDGFKTRKKRAVDALFKWCIKQLVTLFRSLGLVRIHHMLHVITPEGQDSVAFYSW